MRGPARLPSLVTWPTRITGVPCSCDQAASRAADSRTWPTEPAGPSSPSVVSVWTESTTSSPGIRRSAAARTESRAVSASTWMRAPATPEVRPSRSARRCSWSADSSPEAYSTSVPPSSSRAGPSPRSAPPRRRSPAPGSTCRCPAHRPAAPALRAPARRRGPGPPRRCRRSAVAPASPPPHAADAVAPANAPAAASRPRAARDAAGATVSTSDSQVPHTWHLPSQAAETAPQDWQTYRLAARATR